MSNSDNDMIATPWGGKRWGFIRKCMEVYNELIDAELMQEFDDDVWIKINKDTWEKINE